MAAHKEQAQRELSAIIMQAMDSGATNRRGYRRKEYAGAAPRRTAGVLRATLVVDSAPPLRRGFSFMRPDQELIP
jgi:hypothetical protein